MMRQVQGVEPGTGRSRSGRLAVALAALACAWGLIGAAAADASVVSIGSVLPASYTPTEFTRVQTFFNTALPEGGANLTSPASGAVVRWRVQGAVGGPFYLRVLHPNGKGAYEATATSLPATPTGEGLQTFSTNLPIEAGDLIGIDPTSGTDKIGVSEVSGASYGYIFPAPFNGSIVPPSGTEAGKEVQLSAEVQPAPEVTLVSPFSGSVKGGTIVTITGKNLSGASAVDFGTAPAASFKVDSDTEITATAPAATRPGKVDLKITTLAGSNVNTRFDDFVYRACVVPKVTGGTLKAAKLKLRRGGCKLGHVKKVHASRRNKGKVLTQQPKAGKVLAPGTRVRIKLGT